MTSRDPDNPGFAGGETVIAEFAKALHRAGHQVTYLCSTFPGAARESSMEGVRVLRLGPEHFLGPFAFRAYRRRFWGETDLVLEDVLGGSRIPFFAPTYVRQPIVGVWHQDHLPLFRNEYPGALYPALASLERLVVHVHRRCAFLVPSRQAETDLVAKGIPQKQVRVFHPGISTRLRTQKTPPTARQRCVRLCLGKIRRYKCLHHGIQVLAQLVDDVPEASLTIMGRQGERGYLEELVRLATRLGVRDRVTFEIGASEERKMELLRSSRALLATAPIEGFGIAVVEASACGLPVVGTTGIPTDALQEGVNGYRVPFGDILRMRDLARGLLVDDDLFDRLSLRARTFAQQFTWERATRPLLELVEEIGARGVA